MSELRDADRLVWGGSLLPPYPPPDIPPHRQRLAWLIFAALVSLAFWAGVVIALR
jgi:hypothetical protein